MSSSSRSVHVRGLPELDGLQDRVTGYFQRGNFPRELLGPEQAFAEETGLESVYATPPESPTSKCLPVETFHWTTDKRDLAATIPDTATSAPSTITIQVSGFMSSPNEEMVRLYFENKKRSGGGDIQWMEVRGKKVFIVFKDPTDARLVLSREHRLDETTLKLKEVQSRSLDNTHLLVKGLKESITEDTLRCYLEHVGIDEVITVEYGIRSAVALITVNKISNFEQITTKAEYTPLEGQQVILERVPVPDAIIVTDLPDTVSRDLLELYFDSETRSGGGPISDIKMDSSTGTAVVQFDDANTVNRVHQTSPHILNNTPVSVKPYYECLVEVVDDDAPGAFKMPQPINIKIRPKLIPFAFAMPKFVDQLSRRLAEVQAKADMTVTDVVTISPTLTPEMKGIRKLARHWEDKSRSCVEKFFTQFRATKIPVATQIWRRTKDRFEKAFEKVSNFPSKGDDIWVQCFDDDDLGGGVVTLIGTTEAVSRAKLVCNTFIRETENLLDWEASNNITIQVSGFLSRQCPNEEMLRLYFEDNNQSGGGDIQEIQVRDKKVFIVFKNPTVAWHVLRRDHRLEGTTLKLNEVQHPRALDNTHLLVKGLKESTTKEMLILYLENISDDEVMTVDYSTQPGVALVTLNNISYFEMMAAKAQFRPLEGQHLTLERVSIPDAIIVTDLPDTVSRDLLELYFDSETRSGGGPISDIKMDSSTGTAVVQFDDANTVNRVHQKFPHILHNTPVSVKPYYECLVEVVDDNAPGAFKMPQPINVKIKPELIPFAFAMPKYVEQLTKKLAEVNAEVDMTVTDEVKISPTLTPEMKGIRKLAKHWEDKSRSHVEQFFTQFQIMKVPVAILIWRRAKDRFEKVSENIGDDIWVQCSDDDYSGGGVVTLIGTTEAVSRAKLVCDTFIRETQNLLDWEASNNIIIQVSGFMSCPNQEMVRLYFENKKRSGGGDIQGMEVSDKTIFIVFKDPTVAWQVLRGDHRLNETILKLKEVRPDDTHLLVKGFREGTTKETLQLYLEHVGIDEVITVEYGTQPGVALVTCNNISNFEGMVAKAQFRPLEGQHLTLERVPIPDAIIVTDLPDTVSRDLLELYFDSETRSGGGPISDIKMDSSTGTAVVQFDATKTVNRVHQKSAHILNNTPVSVKPYYECLVEVVDDNAPGAFKMPQPINIKIRPKLIPFAFAMPKYVEQLTKKLAEVNAEVDMTVTDEVKISPTLTPEMKGIRKLAKYWEDKSRSCVEKFFTQFQAMGIHVANNIWQRAKDSFEKVSEKVSNVASEGNDLWVQCTDEEGGGVVTLIGTAEAVSRTKLDCKTVIEETEELLKWEATIVTDNITNMKAAKLKVLELNNFQGKHQDVEIKFDIDKQSVGFMGQQALVQNAKTDLFETTNNLAEERVSLSRRKLFYLKSDKGRKHLEDSLKKNDIKAAFDMEDEEMTLLAQQDSEVNVAKYLLQQVVSESSVAVAEESRDLLTKQDFASHLTDVRQRLSVDIHVAKDKVWVVGPPEKVATASNDIESYIAQNTIITVSMEVAEGTATFLDCYRKAAVTNVERNHAGQHAQITIDQGKLSVRGNKDGIQSAMKQLQFLIDDVATDTMTITKPGMHKFFTEGTGNSLLKVIQMEVKCVIVVGESQEHLPELQEGPEKVPHLGFQMRPSSPEETASETARPSNTLTTPEGITIQLKKGDITAEEADVLVNTTDGDLDLSQSGVSKAFGQAGGQELQQFCNNHPKADAGDVVITQPAGTLKCKEVYHGVLPNWQESDQPLRTMVHDLLELAHDDRYTSIAFPAMGTGNLKYPHDVAASCMYDEIWSFSQSNPGTTLKDVRIIVFDQPTVQAFETELRDIQGCKKLQNLKQPQQQMTIGSVTVQIQGSDLTTENVDCIVNVTSKDLGLRGQVSQAICQKAGSNIAAECRQYIIQNGQQDHGDVVLTGAGMLPCKGILHLIHPNAQVLKESIKTCLQVAETKGFKSIAFPAVGTGGFQISPDQAASLMMDGVADFAQQGVPTSLTTVRITVFQQQMLQNFHSEMDRRAQDLPHKAKRFTAIKSRFKITHSLGKKRLVAKILGLTLIDGEHSVVGSVSMAKPPLLLQFSGREEVVDLAKSRVQEIVDTNFKEEKIEDPAVQQLSDDEVGMLKMYGHQKDVAIKVEKSGCHCITIQGITNMTTVVGKVWKVLHDKKEEARKMEQALSLQKDISWCCEQRNGAYVPFDPLINFQIEKAFKKNRKGKVQYEDDAGQCEIDFSTMKEKASGQTSNVCRDDLKIVTSAVTSAVPDHWDPHPTDPNSRKPKLCHNVKLYPSSDEYKTVSSKFGLGNIVNIRRVQNPTLWSQYCAQRQKISLKNPGINIEQELWHGSSADSCGKITYNGFNRSYAGLHGTLIGKGTYFAVNASYSAERYASPDARGHKSLFLAKVLTGLSTPGNNTMVVPPLRPDGGPLDTYDSTSGVTSDDRETRWWERGVKEAIYERMYNPTLNREGGLRVDLSGTWDLALPAPRTDNT
ncbi:positive regulation of interleukin-4-mediated signaling pathway [Branchiostoma belcheri]|nr:positive regulation of interleukin-4-mediated signaling pathway [Branchiostoma belcheri]